MVLWIASSGRASKSSITSRIHPQTSFDDVLEAVSDISLELIEAPRALPVLDENDYKKINYYVQHFYQQKNQIAAKGSFLGRLFGKVGRL